MTWRPILAAALLSACTAPDAHVPPFARVPYQALSAQTVVALALREWRMFGAGDGMPSEQIINRSTGGPTPEVSLVSRAAAMPTPHEAQPPTAAIGVTSTDAVSPERADGLWQRVGEYWWIGLDAGSDESGWTGRHDGRGRAFAAEQDSAFAWSAAFVSYVMRLAGAGARFPYAADHATYINAARAGGDWVVAAERPSDVAPSPGDLICRGRDRAVGIRYDDLPAPRFPAHCDIVVTEPIGGFVTVIGGNVGNAVTRRRFAVDGDGRLLPADPPWLVVLRVKGSERIASR